MIEPLRPAINAWLQMFQCFPSPIINLVGLAVVVFFVTSIINILQHGR